MWLAVFCYVETLYGGVSAEALDLRPCTHVIDAFMPVDAAGRLQPVDGLPRRPLIDAAHRRGARVLVSIGGAQVPSASFAAAAAHPEELADRVARLLADGGYDGVDLDWEFPDATTRARHLALVRALRARLGGAVITVAVTTGAHLAGYDFPGLAEVTDAFIQLGYDFRNPALGPWAHTEKLWPDGEDQPIEASVRGVASELVRRGVPRAKLIIALPFYASDGQPWLELRGKDLGPVHQLYLENQVGKAWVTGPAAMTAKVRKILYGQEISGGPAGGIAIWQLGHQGKHHDLTDAVLAGMRR